MVKIAIAGDVHGHFDILFAKAADLGADVILQVGDTGIFPDPSQVDAATRRHGACQEFLPYLQGGKPVPIPTWVIKGNHEDFEYLDSVKAKGGLIVPNLRYVPNGSIIELDGIRFGALGGNFSPRYFYEARPTLQRRRHFTIGELDALTVAGFDVLLLHDGPYNPERRKGSSVLTDFIRETQPSRVYHGHFHLPYHSSIGKTKLRVKISPDVLIESNNV
ncbi:metallophosphoesterase [Candidatus Woesearchaeota archaeon]|nr:metallophosphoesterase [Candidatus Woesearchaeota archaeon]